MEVKVISETKKFQGEQNGYRVEATAAEINDGKFARIESGQIYDENGQYMGWFSSNGTDFNFGSNLTDSDKRQEAYILAEEFVNAIKEEL